MYSDPHVQLLLQLPTNITTTARHISTQSDQEASCNEDVSVFVCVVTVLCWSYWGPCPRSSGRVLSEAWVLQIRNNNSHPGSLCANTGAPIHAEGNRIYSKKEKLNIEIKGKSQIERFWTFRTRKGVKRLKVIMCLLQGYDLSQSVEASKEFVERFNKFLSRKNQRQGSETDDVCE